MNMVRSKVAAVSMPADDQDNSPAPVPRNWWVYMVRAANGHLYTGISTDPERRFRQHQRGTGARFFRRSAAIALVWSAPCTDHSDALRRELAIKALSKARKEALINGLDDCPSTPASDCTVTEAATKLLES